MEIYLAVGTAFCIAMLISGYKSFRCPESRFYRMTAWVSSALLGMLLFADSVLGIIPRQEPTQAEAETLAAAMKDTEKFLMRLPEVKQVEYSRDNGKLKIIVTVSSAMNEDTVLEFKDEIAREFLHNVVDELDTPNNRAGVYFASLI